MDIIYLKNPDGQTIDKIVEVWESAVRATHDFLSEKDIVQLRPLVRQALPEVEKLFCIFGPDVSVIGFMGINGDKLEMLFVDPAFRGKGFGKKLAGYAVNELKVRFVDVNEQNPAAAGFYEHIGFKAYKRSALDGQGNPFPILHMKKE